MPDFGPADCKECGSSFTKHRLKQEYCGQVCRMKWHSRERNEAFADKEVLRKLQLQHPEMNPVIKALRQQELRKFRNG
jgi:hypothetical protein